MLIGSSRLKINAKRTLSGGYWSCLLVSLVLGIAAGTGSIGGTYRVDTEEIKNGSFRAGIHSVGLQDILNELNIPFYMMGTFMMVMMGLTIAAVLLVIFFLQPLEVGCRKFFIEARKGEYDFSRMGMAFSSSYLNVVKIMMQRWLFTFFWTLLFIIPGIVKAYEYRMIPYILADDPSMSSKEVFRKSREMMYGDKMNAFWFDLSFILWFALSSLTFGLAGIFFVDPYYNNSCTELYALLLSKTEKAQETYSYSQTNVQSYGNYSPGNDRSSGNYSPGNDRSSGNYSSGDVQPSGNYSSGDVQSSENVRPSGNTVPADEAKPFDRPYGQ